jgi:phytoene dehydrogenase-like protein
VGEKNLPGAFVNNLKNLKFSPFEAIRVGCAIHEAPKYTAGTEFEKSVLLEYAPRNYEEYLRSFHQLELGYMPYNIPCSSTMTLMDPTRAPKGKHTFYLYSYAPYELEGDASKWHEKKHEVEEGLLATVRKHTTNMGPENIIAIDTETPLDLEERNPAMIRGDFCHLGMTLSQEMGNRYLPGWNYKTPVKNFWMCGPSTHPGIGVTGGGRAAVQAIMDDFGIDFDKVIRK